MADAPPLQSCSNCPADFAALLPDFGALRYTPVFQMAHARA
jgi:hypothetical protein